MGSLNKARAPRLRGRASRRQRSTVREGVGGRDDPREPWAECDPGLRAVAERIRAEEHALEKAGVLLVDPRRASPERRPGPM
jgi:hypothetical protein